MWIAAIIILVGAGLLFGAVGVGFALILCGFIGLVYVGANGLVFFKLNQRYKEMEKHFGPWR